MTIHSYIHTADAADAETASDTAKDEKQEPGERIAVESHQSLGDKHNATRRLGDDDDSDSSGGRAISTSSDEENDEEQEVLMRETFCPALHPDLLNVAFKVFDPDDNGTVTKEVRAACVLFPVTGDYLWVCLDFAQLQSWNRKLEIFLDPLIDDTNHAFCAV